MVICTRNPLVQKFPVTLDVLAASLRMSLRRVPSPWKDPKNDGLNGSELEMLNLSSRLQASQNPSHLFNNEFRFP